jgi:prevent-host-death family protein
MKEVGILEAKTRLSGLIAEVETGEEVMITRHGKPVARLVAAEVQRRPAPDIAARVRALREEIAQKHGVDASFDWKAAVEEGRS